MMNTIFAKLFSDRRWHSISTRITLITLLVCITGGGLLAMTSSYFLSAELKKEFSSQQMSSATLIAAQLDNKLNVLVDNLEVVSMQLNEAGMHQASELQSSLEANTSLPWLFNAGVFVIDPEQQMLAAIPTKSKFSLPMELMQEISSISERHQSVVMEPLFVKQFEATVIPIVVPIRNKGGRTLGSLLGFINLDLPGAFEYFSNLHYGKSGYYALVAPKSRLIIATTDPKRKMERLPVRGVNPVIDQFVDGLEGTREVINPKGELVLSSVKRLDTSGWLVVVSLPIAEAYSVINQLKVRVLLSSALVTLFFGIFLLWMIRKQLLPLALANAAVLAQSDNIDTTIEIPVASQDEIGQLVSDFNHLLQMLRERDSALVWSEQRFRAIFDAEPECVKLVDANGKLIDMNAAGLRMLEADTVDQVKEQGLSAFIVDEYRTQFSDLFDAVINGKSGSLVFEAKGRRGTRRWLESHAIPFLNRENGENLMLAVTRDITQQKQAELELLASEFRWKFAIEGSGDGLWDWNLQTNTVYFSNRWKEMLGFVEHEVNNHFDEWAKRVHPEDMAAAIHDIQEHQQGRTPAYKNTHRMLCKDGQWKWILARGMVVARDENGQALRMIGTHTDISEPRALQEALQDSLKEKLGLLNEVHHRVKNNLQVVTSLLRLESGRSDSPETKNVLNDMQARIRSMALLHESLYRSGIFASADLGAYLRELATHAFRAHISSAGIQLHVDVVSVNVTMDQATPCGLLVSELISNSLKHAFPDDRYGEVRLSLQAHGDVGQMRLCISDNGQGMPEDFAERCERSLGLRLVSDLAKQMRGELTVIYHPHAQFMVVFNPDLVQAIHHAVSSELLKRQEVLV